LTREQHTFQFIYSKDPQTGTLEILDEDHYYPFGLKHGVYSAGNLRDFKTANLGDIDTPILEQVRKTEYQYKYNGKEWQDELALNMYAMDMRHYDPAIARWVVQDPITHYYQSPYTSFDGNPVFWADPSGAAVEKNKDYVKFTGDDAKEVFQLLKNIMNENEGNTDEANTNQNNNSAQNLDNGDPPGKKSSEEGNSIERSDIQSKGGHVFGALEIVAEKATDYIVDKIFDYFGWDKDYQDEVTMAASLVVNKGNPAKVAAKTGVKFSKAPPGGLIKLKRGQGWKDEQGNIWKKDMKHKDHWDVTNPKTGKKVKEIDFDGNQIWPNGPKNKNKR
jgi:RHS repeat-associated protein